MISNLLISIVALPFSKPFIGILDNIEYKIPKILNKLHFLLYFTIRTSFRKSQRTFVL